MGVINRAAVILRPKQPFLDWAKSLPDPEAPKSLETLDWEPAAYLVPEAESKEQIAKMVETEYEFFFTEALNGWWDEEKDFPKPLTLKMFKEWFSVEIRTVVEDLVDGPIAEDGEEEPEIRH